jgi:ATP-binding cassette, subfamily B, bacterial MsbA
MNIPKRQSLPKDPYSTRALISRTIFEHGLPHWRNYAFVIALMTITAGCTAVSAYLFGHVVNATYVSRDFPSLLALCVGTIVVFTVKGFATYGQAVLLTRTAGEITAKNQRRMVDRLLCESLSYFARRHTTEQTARINFSAGAPSNVLNLLVASAARDMLSVVFLGGVIISQDPLMSLMGIAAMVLAAALIRRLRERLATMTREQFAASAGLLETMQEVFHGMRVVKTFVLEDAMRERAARSIEATRRAAAAIALISNSSTPAMETLGGIIIGGVLLYGGYRVIETGATPGTFVSFVTAFLLAYEPAKRLTRFRLDLSGLLVGVGMLYRFLDSPVSEPDDHAKPSLSVGAGRIEFCGVDFAYRPEEHVLVGMSFVAEAGRLTALIGQSGSGKSTVLNLLLRLYEASAGSIRIDGQDIAAVSRESLRRQIAYVPQDVFLFHGSIRDNIAIGRQGASEGEIIAAATAAFAHDFIVGFPNGYETPVGEHGLQLSTGQRQRIAIARALLKDASIILLDEPTAALDAESEREVRSAIARLCAGRTTLVIAHRLNTIIQADCIHLVADGRIVESGRHIDLLRDGRRYRELSGTAPAGPLHLDPDQAPRDAAE